MPSFSSHLGALANNWQTRCIEQNQSLTPELSKETKLQYGWLVREGLVKGLLSLAEIYARRCDTLAVPRLTGLEDMRSLAGVIDISPLTPP